MQTERDHENAPPQEPAKQDKGKEDLQISQPHIERAEGPFEHSGEASGWTKEEKEEKEQQDKNRS